ncbi:MAG TPA: ATP synthase subunit I [Acidimicrobiales bacterium]|nr:ATP synthase subunit I [Acidimicrobiales bacterium]
MRRTAYASIAIGIVGAVIAVVLGQPSVPVGLAIGLGLAIINHRVFQSSALRFTTDEGVVSKKPFAGSVALRLGVCTAIAFGLLYLDQPVGWGVIAGLALFQVTMLFYAMLALLRFQRQQIDAPGDSNA